MSDRSNEDSPAASVYDLTNLSTDTSTLLQAAPKDDEGVSSSSDDMFSLNTTPPRGPKGGGQSRRSSPRYSDGRGAGRDEPGRKAAAICDAAALSPPSAGASTPRVRSSPRQPKRTSFPASEGYSAEYVDEAPDAPGVENGGGGSRSSPVAVASSQGSGDGNPAESETSDGSGGSEGSEGSGVGGKKPAGRKKQQTPMNSSSGGDINIRWWTRKGEKEALYRLITKHPASRYSASKEKKKEWMKVLRGLDQETQLTIAVKEAVQRSDGTETTSLVHKKVVVNMKPKMEGMSEKTAMEKLKTIWGADRKKWKARQEKKKALTGEGSDGEDEESEALSLEEAFLAWEAGSEEKGAASKVQKEQGAKALGERDKAKDEYAARTKGKHADRPRQRTALRGAAKGASKGKGKAKGRGGGLVGGKTKRARAQSPSSESDDDGDGSDYEEATTARRSSIGRRSVQDVEDSSDDSGKEQQRMEDEAMERASGSGGRSTRSGKEGGKRKRSIQPLSGGMGGGPLQDKVIDLIDDLRESRVRSKEPSLTKADVEDMVKDQIAAGIAEGFRQFEAQRQQQQQQQWNEHQHQVQPQARPLFPSGGAMPSAHGAGVGFAPMAMPNPSISVHGTAWAGPALGGAAMGMAMGGVGNSAAVATPRESKRTAQGGGVEEAPPRQGTGGGQARLSRASAGRIPRHRPSRRRLSAVANKIACWQGPSRRIMPTKGVCSGNKCAKLDVNQQCNFFKWEGGGGGSSLPTSRNSGGASGGRQPGRGGPGRGRVGGYAAPTQASLLRTEGVHKELSSRKGGNSRR